VSIKYCPKAGKTNKNKPVITHKKVKAHWDLNWLPNNYNEI
jgi:hypothetical protein